MLKTGCSYMVTEEEWSNLSAETFHPWNKAFIFRISYRCTYLPRGTSMSSFLQRTFGWGSPCTWQRNSMVSSSRTTWLMGLRRKVGRSVEWAHGIDIDNFIMSNSGSLPVWEDTLDVHRGFFLNNNPLCRIIIFSYPSIMSWTKHDHQEC